MREEMPSLHSSRCVDLSAFDGTNYQMWDVKMEAYLDANDPLKAVEQEYEVPDLLGHPTLAQMKNHKEKKLRKSKARATLFTAVSSIIFNRIMTMKTAKEIWDLLKQEIVQKILVPIPEKFEATITSLENSRDLSRITLAELLNALQAQEQRRLMRQEGFLLKQEIVQKILVTIPEKFEATITSLENSRFVKNYPGRIVECSASSRTKKAYEAGRLSERTFHLVLAAKKTNHPQNKCWWRQNAKCNNCGQLGHMERICKSQQQQDEAKAVVEQPQEDQLFTVSCFATLSSTERWLIDENLTQASSPKSELEMENISL
ncbi:uncharacterized protein LOC111411412 [Olea europaea var. sylvestris]|uniref:uncharacterized protein LOC111411412 n=1 Tax=Olea europaea var. sylvestris TaxID=158386 RepID=UPI000C1D46DA|nr:uncharacterized protein LOC111411412 [Olea europaea var. sylvestris]